MNFFIILLTLWMKHGGIFLGESIKKKKKNCSLCYNAFREQYCSEFLIYKCLCKSCEGEEIICRFCSQHVNDFVHLCNCGKYCERHLTRNLVEDIRFI